MGDTLTIQVTGMDVIERNLDALQQELPDYLGMAGKEAASEILDTKGLRKYPDPTAANAPPTPYYIRGRGTQTAHGNRGESERYGTRWTVNYREMTTIIANNASYARYVGGDDQASFMPGKGWRKLSDVANEKIDAITKIFNGWVKKLIKDKNLS